jgi:cytochrome c553
MKIKYIAGFYWIRLAIVGSLLTFAHLAVGSPPVLGKCVACHGADGHAHGNMAFPVIAGMPPVHIEEAMYAYKDGARQCRIVPLMCDTAKGLSDEEVVQVAEYYGTQERFSSSEDYDEELSVKGEQIHEKLCSRCHVPPDDAEVEDALGIPLHGQRSLYLRYAIESYLDGTRENLLPAMAEKLETLEEEDIEALVNYYANYKPVVATTSPEEAPPPEDEG